MNDSNIKKITDKIFQNSRMDLDFFMYLPSGIWGSRDRSTINLNLNPVLYLRYRQNKKVSEEYDYSKACYKITPRNLYQVVKFFNTIVKWFFDDKYHDLFLTNEEGNLIFNADYNKLHVSTPRGDYSSQVMQAIPTVVQIGDKTYEGIHLYINKMTYCIPLTYEEIDIIFGILKEFSFTTETTKVLVAYDSIIRRGEISTQEQMQLNKKTPFD